MRAGEAEPSMEGQLDFFHKLGYSTAQVEAVQQQLGSPSMDTDKVLGELVRVGHHHHHHPPGTTMSVLVARGDVKAAGPTAQLPVGPTVQTPALSSSEESGEDEDALRPIVIDGSNVAMSHGNKEVFSCLGIQLTVDFFLDRGHTDVTVFVPSWRKEQPRPDVPITDQHILRDLEKRKILVFTPSRRVAGKRVVCNDDWFIVKLAYESDGVVVSNDMYRDLQGKEPEWKRFIEERLLMYSFVNNKFMPPDDPLGRHGPTLENFLRRHPKTQKRQLCPYGKKCTFGNRCKFHHPERGKQSSHSLADELRENAAVQKQSPTLSSATPGQSLSLVEDMAKKLTLGPDGGSAKAKKDQLRVSQRSGRRTAHRAGRTQQSPDHSLALLHAESQEQLDSGLGSIDSWSDHQYGGSHGSSQHLHGPRHKFCPPAGALCSCCPHSSPPAHHYQQGESDLSYGPAHFCTYGPYPVSRQALSQPPEFQCSHHRHHYQQQRYWSAPLGSHPLPSHPQRAHWSAPRGTQGTRPSKGGEREVVRKKLLAIFSAQLVDTAMGMFPQEMDPQVLVAEIVTLQSQQGRPIR